jgi:hypothetical protein
VVEVVAGPAPVVDPEPTEPVVEVVAGPEPIVGPVVSAPPVVKMTAGSESAMDSVVGEVVAGPAPVVDPEPTEPVVAGPEPVVDSVVTGPVVGTHNVNVGDTKTDSPGVEHTLVASLHQKSSIGPEAVRPLTSSSSIVVDTDRSEMGMADDLQKTAEWGSQPAPELDALSSGRTHSEVAHEGDVTKTVGSGRDGNLSPSASKQDGTQVSPDSVNQASSGVGQVPWPTTEEAEEVPDESGDLAMPMALGLVGAALQGNLGKKDKLTTTQPRTHPYDQKASAEKAPQQSNVEDGNEAPSQR